MRIFPVTCAFLLPLVQLASAPPLGGTESPAVAQNGASSTQRLSHARNALKQGFPHAVLHSLRQLVGDRELSPEERREAFPLLLEAELAAGRPGAVVNLVAAQPSLATEPIVRFWVARALAESDDTSTAGKELAQLAAMENFPYREECALRAASLLMRENRNAEAKALLDLIPAASPLHLPAELERAALLLQAGDPAAAEQILQEINEVPPGFQSRQTYLLARARHEQADFEGALLVLGSSRQDSGSPLAEAAAVLRAAALAQLGQTADAVAALESYLLQAKGPLPRDDAFSLLEKLLVRQASPALGELRRMAADETQPARAMQASLALARVEMALGRPQAAREILQTLTADKVGSEIRRRATILRARIELADGQPGTALQLLNTLTQDAEIAFWRGCSLIALQRYEESVDAFALALSDPALQFKAAFNGKIAHELGRIPVDDPGFSAVLKEKDPAGGMEKEIHLQVALEKARNGHREAVGRLRDLVPELGPRAAVPLAEWLFVSNQPGEAAAVLETAGLGSSAREQEARAYLEIFLADSPGQNDPSGAEELARSFLKIYPDSQRTLEVKLKLGEILQRKGDYLSAYEIFQDVAQTAPDPESGANAWFLAGKAATRLMDEEALERAILAFEEAAQAGGEVASRARFEQALLFNARGDSGEAVVLLDRVAENTADPELRCSALMEKGDSLFNRGLEDPDFFRQAIETWSPLLEENEASASWRDQALTKTGLAHMRLGETDAALENFYAVVLGERSSPGGVWFERAGFEAARLLEERQAWAEAVKLYQILSDAGGPRAEEASTRANRVRLENFLWEG